eukprot:scaffold1411_cov396-Prasinococcus_capsulatus_cf.AAC.32
MRKDEAAPAVPVFRYRAGFATSHPMATSHPQTRPADSAGKAMDEALLAIGTSSVQLVGVGRTWWGRGAECRWRV